VLLRDTAGYIVAARAQGAEGASAFDRILLLSKSSSPLPAAAPPAVARRRPTPEARDGEVPEGLASLLRAARNRSDDAPQARDERDDVDEEDDVDEAIADDVEPTEPAAQLPPALREILRLTAP
jgi:hypothetical protein